MINCLSFFNFMTISMAIFSNNSKVQWSGFIKESLVVTSHSVVLNCLVGHLNPKI